jgi:hypothetical protein
MSRSAKPHHRKRVDASVSGGERQTPSADDQRKRHAVAAVNAVHRHDLGSA